MRVWNIGTKEINQLYNNLNIIIPPNTIKELPEDTAVFLLSKKNIRGMGLVQLKDGDSKEERYIQGRQQIYEAAISINSDYERHCEELREINKQPLKPHATILKAQKLIKEYDEWIEAGSPVSDDLKEIVGEAKVMYGCPYCSKDDFPSKNALKGHMLSHSKEGADVNSSTVENKGKGKS